MPAPRPARLPFSCSSSWASLISWRTSVAVWSESCWNSSPTGLSSVLGLPSIPGLSPVWPWLCLLRFGEPKPGADAMGVGGGCHLRHLGRKPCAAVGANHGCLGLDRLGPRAHRGGAAHRCRRRTLLEAAAGGVHDA